MLWISFLVVAIFIWLVFNNPYKEKLVRDTYENFLREVEDERRQNS